VSGSNTCDLSSAKTTKKEKNMAEDLALDLQELRQLGSIAKRPRVISLISSEISHLEKVIFFIYFFLKILIY
jgi:hypothetical protein